MASSKGQAQRLQGRRHKGESAAGKLRGPNTGAWEKTHIPIRRNQEGVKSALHPSWWNYSRTDTGRR